MKRFTPYQLLSTVLIALLSTCAAGADKGKDQSVPVELIYTFSSKTLVHNS